LGQGRGGSGATQVELIIVTLRLDNGNTGTGFTYALTGGGTSIKALIDDTLSEQVVGSSLLEWDAKWHQLWHMTHRLGRGVALPAISAIDIAVWDAKARESQLPLYQLLGAIRDEVPVYGSGRATHSMTTEQLIEGAQSYIAEGYKAIKLRAGAFSLAEDVQRISTVRQAVGPDIQIMIDCNERLNYADALWLGKKLADLDIYWMEEPLAADDVLGHKRLAEQLNLNIAVGEHLQGRFEFVQYIDQRAASILQPDAPLVGGISEWKRIATIAEGFGLSISPHFLPELHIHLAASTNNCISIEHFPLIDDVLETTLQAHNGYMRVPQTPGHGIQWDEEKLEYYEKLS
jgi:L-alanine-DL-glutamate epimerase-like enolase superfamily enzyme